MRRLTLAPTPNLYVSGDPAYAGLPETLQTSEIDLLYVTDRKPEGTDDDPRYGYHRSKSAAWGLATVHFGEETDWTALVAASTDTAAQRPELSLTRVTELGRFPPTPWPYTVVDDQVVADVQILAERDRQARRVRARLHPLLRAEPRRDVLVFVHGFNNDFSDSVLSLSNWLFSNIARAGRLRRGDIREHDWRVMQSYDNINFVDYNGNTSGYSHSYFRDSPASAPT